MTSDPDANIVLLGEYPPAVDMRAKMREMPLPISVPGTVDPAAMSGDEATNRALTILRDFNTTLASADAEALERCFFSGQAYWKDSLALTWHLRTFTSPRVIAASLLQTKALRGLDEEIRLEGAAQFIPATPVLQFIDCSLVFSTGSPAATCNGRMILLPVKTSQGVEWKIWILSTWLESLDAHREDEALLVSPGRQLGGFEQVETDVFIIGGGNAAVALAARLKALGVDSVMAERNAAPGDNWASRYDCMRFHIPTSVCELPYMRYDRHLQTPHFLSGGDLAEQVRRYVTGFNLNMIPLAKIQSTVYDRSARRWVVRFMSPHGNRTAVSKHLVQATGFGSQKPRLPRIANEDVYKGISIHSAQYKNAALLRERGVKSVLVIGSANTAFDIVQDCHAAGLQTTMVVRSPTYIVPVEDICDKRCLGVYDSDVEAADRLFMTVPTWVDNHILCGLLAHMASQEPDRYAALARTGFPVIDGTHPDASLGHHLLERAGGHYVDIGGTALIAEGKVGVKAGVEPIGYTATGLCFSDGSAADADAVVWCTGFADQNARSTATEILGAESIGNKDREGNGVPNVLGPSEIAARLDATWGVDAEGEVRGMWKRHLRVDNYWIMGGHTQHHRWHSRTVALQIKAELEGMLPPAYRGTPAGGKLSEKIEVQN